MNILTVCFLSNQKTEESTREFFLYRGPLHSCFPLIVQFTRSSVLNASNDTYGSVYVVFLQERLSAAVITVITVRGKKGIDWELIPAFLFFILFLSFHIKLRKRKLLNNNVNNTIVLIESFHCSAHTCRLRLTDHDIKHF